MAYYSRHSIFLYDNDKQKLLYLQSLIEEEKLSFELREETVYQYDGEPLNILPIEPKPNRYSMTICWRYERQEN